MEEFVLTGDSAMSRHYNQLKGNRRWKKKEKYRWEVFIVERVWLLLPLPVSLHPICITWTRRLGNSLCSGSNLISCPRGRSPEVITIFTLGHGLILNLSPETATKNWLDLTWDKPVAQPESKMLISCKPLFLRGWLTVKKLQGTTDLRKPAVRSSVSSAEVDLKKYLIFWMVTFKLWVPVKNASYFKTFPSHS